MMLRRHQDVLPDFKDRKTQGEPNPEQFVARMLEQWATLLHPFLPANSVAFPSSPQSSVTLGQLMVPRHPGQVHTPSVASRQSRTGSPINEGEAEPATNLQLGPTRAKQGEFSERTERQRGCTDRTKTGVTNPIPAAMLRHGRRTASDGTRVAVKE